MLKKIISAGDDRRSRFHTEDNIFIGWSSVFSETPIVAAQKIRSRLSGRRPVAPWWPLPAIREVEKRLNTSMRAIEFGSGSSSIWIAKRVGSLICREHHEEWANETRQRLKSEGLDNCEVQHRSDQSYYCLEPDDRFDFAVIDGEYRWKCLETLSGRMNQGGMIYFDNSDSDKDAKHYSQFGLTGTHQAQAVVQDLEKSGKAHVENLHGMIHGEIFAGSGMLITFP
jgi:precorrin-6B methylase 2